MREFFRVLRPGGRASLFEPVNVLMSAADPDLFYGYDVTPVKELAARVQALYASIQPLGADPMVDFDDRDLVRHARDAGFSEISLELRVSVKNRRTPCPGNGSCAPRATRCSRPSWKPCSRYLSRTEADELARHLRPLVESGTGRERTALSLPDRRQGLAGAGLPARQLRPGHLAETGPGQAVAIRHQPHGPCRQRRPGERRFECQGRSLPSLPCGSCIPLTGISGGRSTGPT